MRRSGIYLIHNTVNGKVYVGQSIHLDGRFSSHLSKLKKGTHHNRHLLAAVKKYGIDSFRFEVLCECPVEMLDAEEQRYLDQYRAWDRTVGYNVCTVAANPLKECTEETRALRSGNMTTFWAGQTDEEKQKRLEGAAGFWKTDAGLRLGQQRGEQLKAWKAQRSPEELATLHERTVEAQRVGIAEYRASLTTTRKEELAEMGRVTAARREAGMTDEERRERRERAAAKQREVWASLSDEQRVEQNAAKSLALKGKKRVFATPDGMNPLRGRKRPNVSNGGPKTYNTEDGHSPLKGRHWYSNGTVELRDTKLPEGFHSGRLSRLPQTPEEEGDGGKCGTQKKGEAADGSD